MARHRLARRLGRIAASAAGTPAPAPVHWDFSCYTLEEQYALDQMLAKARARPDGGTDPSVSTDDEIEALARLATIHAAHLARGGGAVPGDAEAGVGGARRCRRPAVR